MQLENSFTVPVPIDEAWRVLMDIERIAPCMPGAALDSVTGDEFTGRVKVKLGPINLTYQGKASFVERDEAAHRAVIDARGKDQRGNGTAAAIVTATLAGEGSVTRVDVLTDLNITGRPAQFGRGVMTDVGNKLLGQFADKLSAQLASGDAGLVDQSAAEQSQEPTVAKTAAAAGAKAAATVAGAVEEVAASVEGTAAAEPATKAAAAAKKTAAATADTASTAEKSAVTAPIKAAKAPATAAPAEAAPVPAPLTPSAPAAGDAPAAATTPITTAKKAPSKPPTGTTAPPNRPAGGGPVKSSPASAAAPRQLAPVEPEPIDLLEVAGGAALTRYAAPAAGAAVVVLLITLIVRRRRKH
ncbi:MAG TPA: SRPBCC domain-containing protein [Modestobacter sp.]|nr:SRPBCC domain-containing protein [Modestobacter sp.]